LIFVSSSDYDNNDDADDNNDDADVSSDDGHDDLK